MKKRFIYILTIILFLQSCNNTSPEQYFDKTTLNTNAVYSFGRNDFIDYLDFDKNGKQLNKNSCLEYVQRQTVSLKQYIEGVKELKPTEDTKPLIDNSLSLYTAIEKVYENEYVALAKSIDKGTTKQELLASITAIENKHLSEISTLYNQLKEVAIPYAQKNGIKVKFN